jgi:hypothetical protein
MNLPALVGMLIPALTAFLLLQATRWDRRSEPAPALLMLALALGLGIGISSCTYFLALIIADGARGAVIGLDVLVLGLASAAAWRWAAPRRHRRPAPFSVGDWIIAAAVLTAALAAAVTFALNTLQDPHGQWDAWATWNLRARWLARSGPLWWTAFGRFTVHGDYPLLVPAAAARLWVYGGTDASSVPTALAAAYAVAALVLLYGALAALRGRAQGLLGALCLLGTPLFLRSAAWQYADIPLAFNILATLALLAARDHDPACGRSALAWAGLSAGLAAWTKNEGMLFVLCVATARGALALARRQYALEPVKWFVAGLLPVAALLLFFKIALAPPSVFAGQRAEQVLARVADSARYPAIARSAGFEAARGGGALLLSLGLYVVLLGRTRDQAARRAAQAAALVTGLVALGYTAVYLVSPADLTWLLSHSLDRLVLHLWPSALLAFFLYAATPFELLAPAAAMAREPRPRRAAAAGRAVSAPARARRG